MTNDPVLIVCMGVSGSGKSSVGRAIAERFDMNFIEADDYHCDENRARMAAGKPLDDSMRKPWIDRICMALSGCLKGRQNTVLSCSALRRAHRDNLREVGYRTLFLHLSGDCELISHRLELRRQHFMPGSLLVSQYADLQDPSAEGDVVTIDVSPPLDEVIGCGVHAVSAFTNL